MEIILRCCKECSFSGKGDVKQSHIIGHLHPGDLLITSGTGNENPAGLRDYPNLAVRAAGDPVDSVRFLQRHSLQSSCHVPGEERAIIHSHPHCSLPVTEQGAHVTPRQGVRKRHMMK